LVLEKDMADNQSKTRAALARLCTEMTPQRFVLDSGLTVLVSEMPQFKGVHAVFGTRFGSADKSFSLDGQTVELPEGVAHFLEHKLFEDENGNDAFELFSATGASANAFTSFDKTCFLFSATDEIEKNLRILLDFVLHPYFSEKTVQKEQGIIAQEIRMYQDSPEFRMTFGLLGNLYHVCPVRSDIAGTVESIQKITPEMLYRCCEAFYAPDNMVLSVAGNVTARQVLEVCNGVKIAPSGHRLQRQKLQEPDTVFAKEKILKMQVSQPVWGIGYKGPGALGGEVKNELICDFITELLAGETSPLYNRLYDENLINAGFGGEYLSGPGYCSLIFGGETPDPKALQAAFEAEVQRLLKNGVDEEQFLCTKNQMLGQAIMGLESIEDVATDQAAVFLRGHSLYDEVEQLSALTARDVEAMLPTLLDREKCATILIMPTDNDGE